MAEDKSTPQGANKYSIYAQRNVESTQVDWAKIAGDLTKGAEDIRDNRQKRKDEIDVSTQNSMETLSKIDDTNNQDASSLLIDGSGMSTESLRVQSNLLKRGLITPRDYKIFMQNLKNQYSGLSTAVKGWDAWATKANERLNIATEGVNSGSMVASGLEVYQNTLTSSLGNLKNKKLWTNPANGQMQLVTMGKDKDNNYTIMPDPKKNPTKFQSPNTINDLMKFKLDRLNLTESVKRATAPVGKIVTSYIEDYGVLRGGASVVKTEGFRQFGGFDKWKTDQVNAIVGREGDTGNSNASQVLFESGGYQYASTIEQYRELHGSGADESLWIKSDDSSGTAVITLTDTQQKEARRIVEYEIESQIDSIVTKTAPKGGQQKQQDTANTTRKKEEEDRNKAYFGDINTVITGLGTEGAAVSEDRITDMNQRFLNSTNSTDRNTKINSIKRGANEIVINKTVRGVNKPVTVDKFFRDPITDELDLKRPLTSKDIARKIYRELIPRAVTKDMSFDDFYDAALKSGMDFTPKEIEDADGNMIPNPEYGGDEAFSTKTQIEKISNYNSDDFTDLNQTKSIALEFKGLVDADGDTGYRDNFVDAAPVVKKAFSQGLKNVEKAYGSSLDVVVSYNDVRASGDNEIIYSYKDPVTGKKVSDKFIYNDDNTKLQSEVDSKINKIIDAYNTSRASGEKKPVGSGKVDAFGNVIQ